MIDRLAVPNPEVADRRLWEAEQAKREAEKKAAEMAAAPDQPTIVELPPEQAEPFEEAARPEAKAGEHGEAEAV